MLRTSRHALLLGIRRLWDGTAFPAHCIDRGSGQAATLWKGRFGDWQRRLTIRNDRKALLAILAMCLSAFLTGCGGGSSRSCGGSLAAPLTGPGGLTVALSGISNGSQIPCAGLSGGSTCSFTANLSVSQLTQPVTAQLAVQVCTDADGNSFASENPGQSPVFIQPGQIPLMSGSTGGSLDGTLGPPVSSQVRFALQVGLLNSSGQTIASSQPVINLAPE